MSTLVVKQDSHARGGQRPIVISESDNISRDGDEKSTRTRIQLYVRDAKMTASHALAQETFSQRNSGATEEKNVTHKLP